MNFGQAFRKASERVSWHRERRSVFPNALQIYDVPVEKIKQCRRGMLENKGF